MYVSYLWQIRILCCLLKYWFCLICLNYIWLKISYKLPKICSYFQSCHTSCFLMDFLQLGKPPVVPSRIVQNAVPGQ